MNAPTTGLFRTEVLEHRADRLHGDISLAMPMAWHVIGYMFLATLVAAISFLVLGSYARVETVAGSIVLDRGVAPIVPTRSGIVMAVRAQEGQKVAAGAPLIQIRAEEMLAAGSSGPEQILAAIGQQDAGLASQSSHVMAAAEAERGRAGAQIEGLAQEIAELDKQIAAQQELVASAEAEVNAVKGVAERGFISHRDMVQREETVVARRQQLAGLEQARAGKQTSLADARRSVAQTSAQAATQTASLTSSRAELAQRRVDAQASRGYLLAAPIAGTVTAVTARAGQAVSSQQALMTVVPDNAVPRAEIYVPTSAAGFLAPGQEVHLAVDAFPYQRFGTVDATITQISATTIGKPDAAGAIVPVFLVSARIDHPWVEAFGRKQALLPGMTLSARIITQKQSLLEWLFQPLFAVRNR